MPNTAEPTTDTLAGPPLKRPTAAAASLAKKPLPPKAFRRKPKTMNGMTTTEAIAMTLPNSALVSRPR